MNIRRSSQRNRASVLLAVVAAVLVLVVGAIVIYNIIKLAKRLDNGQPQRPPATNDTGVVVPDGGVNITGAEWRDVQFHWEWWDEPAVGVAASPLEVQLLKTNTLVFAWKSDTNLVLRLERQPATNGSDRASFASMGMPVDEYGVPSDLTWRMGTVPAAGTPFEGWSLERSTNLLDWSPITLMEVRPDYTNMVVDESVHSSTFYRAIRQ